ncbi:MAG: hypothetical protein LBF09_06470, partial [Odoribacteraceae bacterium]|nr:hypothetical protein [Odoribacteraceae bacterium]
MYKFKRRVYVGDRCMDFWFGLSSKSRDRHFNFTLYLLTGGPDSPFSHAERVKSGIHSKADASREAILYAKQLFRDLIERERETSDSPALP